MKIRILDRLLVALSGLVLLAACAGIIAQTFFGVQLTDYAAKLMQTTTKKGLIAIAVVAAVLLVLGGYCFLLMFRRRKVKRGFVMQKGENGELMISLKAMDNMTRKVIDRHTEMKLLGTNISPEKDGVIIRLKVALASGVSIPLAVGAVQKQVTEYVSDCSGVQVRQVRVQVDTTDSAEAKGCAYMVPELPGMPAMLTEKPSDTNPIPEEVVNSTKDEIQSHADKVVETPAVDSFEEQAQVSEEVKKQDAAFSDSDNTTAEIDLTMNFADTPAEYHEVEKKEESNEAE